VLQVTSCAAWIFAGKSTLEAFLMCLQREFAQLPHPSREKKRGTSHPHLKNTTKFNQTHLPPTPQIKKSQKISIIFTFLITFNRNCHH